MHEADRAFHHARAAGTGHDDQRLTRIERQFDAPRDFFSDDGAHRTTNEVELHGAADDRSTGELSFGGDYGIVHAELLARFFKTGCVWLGIDELQRIGRRHAGIVLGIAAIEQHLEALLRVHFEVETALWADEQVRFEIFAEDDGAARFALHPQTLGAHLALFGRCGLLDCFFIALEPSHSQFGSIRDQGNTTVIYKG